MNRVRQIIANLKDIIGKLSYILNHKQKIYCFWVFLMTIAGAGFETIGVSVILPFVQALMYPEQLMENRWIARIINALQLTQAFQIIVLVAAGVVAVYLAKNLFLVMLSYIRAKFSGMIQRDLGVYMMRSYMKRGYPYFLGVNASQLHRGITGDVSGVYNIIYNGLRMLSEVFTVAAIGLYILIADVFMALFMLTIAGASVVITIFFCKQKMKVLGSRCRQYDAEMKTISYQTFQGIKEVLVMNKQDYFAETYSAACKEQQKALVGQTVAAESPAYIFEAVCVVGMVLAVCFRLLLGGDSAEFIPAVATIAVAAFRIMPSMGRLTNNANNIMFNIPSMNAAYANMKEANEYEQSVLEKVIEEDKQNRPFLHELELRNVSWQYAGREKKVIENFNLKIQKGDSIALIGESGAGKSTVIDIILGLLQPTCGGVYMDGIDIRMIPSTWCRVIGYVPQSVYILDDTVRKNVAYGVKEEEIDDNMIWDALEQAQMKKFIENLPDGLNTVLGDRGIRFSGGQRQRIAIARALYYNPDILVLDEATSALDNKTEEAIMEAIDFLQGKKTLIIVAHRLTTVEKCKYIYEIRDGKAIDRKKSEIFSNQGIS